ncbi:MAG: hypothetical protein NDI80_02495 [Flavobacteriaceae bacterium]|nr:hypothetical protein [Flavobacteriaceae bacterium]
MKTIFTLIFVLLHFFGVSTKPICAQIEKSIELFTTFKLPIIFQSKCGLESTTETLIISDK